MQTNELDNLKIMMERCRTNYADNDPFGILPLIAFLKERVAELEVKDPSLSAQEVLQALDCPEVNSKIQDLHSSFAKWYASLQSELKVSLVKLETQHELTANTQEALDELKEIAFAVDAASESSSIEALVQTFAEQSSKLSSSLKKFKLAAQAELSALKEFAKEKDKELKCLQQQIRKTHLFQALAYGLGVISYEILRSFFLSKSSLNLLELVSKFAFTLGVSFFILEYLHRRRLDKAKALILSKSGTPLVKP